MYAGEKPPSQAALSLLLLSIWLLLCSTVSLLTEAVRFTADRANKVCCIGSEASGRVKAQPFKFHYLN